METKLDTTTVLAIIKMIDVYISNVPEGIDKGEYWAAVAELEHLKRHLQSYIEGELTALENETRE